MHSLLSPVHLILIRVFVYSEPTPMARGGSLFAECFDLLQVSH